MPYILKAREERVKQLCIVFVRMDAGTQTRKNDKG